MSTDSQKLNRDVTNPVSPLKPARIFTTLATMVKSTLGRGIKVSIQQYEMIGDNTKILDKQHYIQRKRLYYITSSNQVYLKNQFILNLPESMQVLHNETVQSVYSTKNDAINKGRKLISGISEVWNPSNNLHVGWNLIIMVLICIQLLTIPLVLTFSITDSTLTLFDWVTTYIFISDILVQFNTAIYLKGSLVTTRRIITLEYLKLWFWVDLISSFPYDYIFDSPELAQQAQLIRFLRFFKFIKVVRLLRVLKLKKLLQKIEEYLSVMDSLYLLLQIAKLFLLILCISHWCACIINILAQGLDESWIVDYGIDNEPWTIQYITALYFSVTTIITVGYGDVHFVRFEEYIFSIFMMLLASAVFGYTTNIVIASFSNTDEELTQHELMIKRYMKKKKVKSALQGRVTNYIEWLRISYLKQQQMQSSLVGSLSANLKSELICLINGRIVDNLDFFNDFTKDLISNISNVFEEVVYGPEETIIQESSYSQDLYYIMNGSVSIKCNKQILAVKTQEHYFGEVGFFSDKPRSASVISQDFVNLMRLNRQQLLELAAYSEVDLEAFQQIKYYLEIENDYSVINLQCFVCNLDHIAKECPKTHYIFDKLDILRQRFIDDHIPKSVKCKRRQRSKHYNFYLRDKYNLSALNKIQQQTLKQFLLGQQVYPQHNNTDDEVVIKFGHQMNIDTVKIFNYYIKNNNIDLIMLRHNQSADLLVEQMHKIKRTLQNMKQSQLTKERKFTRLRYKPPEAKIQIKFQNIVQQSMKSIMKSPKPTKSRFGLAAASPKVKQARLSQLKQFKRQQSNHYQQQYYSSANLFPNQCQKSAEVVKSVRQTLHCFTEQRNDDIINPMLDDNEVNNEQNVAAEGNEIQSFQ